MQEAPGSQNTGAEGLLEALKEERDCFLLYLTNAGGQSTADELGLRRAGYQQLFRATIAAAHSSSKGDLIDAARNGEHEQRFEQCMD